MLKTTFARFSLTSTAFFASSAFGHPGHDHNHWLSDPIHFLLAFSIAGLVSAGCFVAIRLKTKAKAVVKKER